MYCTLLFVHSCHPLVSSSTSSSRCTIKLNPVTGSQCNTGSGGSSVGAVTRLGELEFDSLQGSEIFLCVSRPAVGLRYPNIQLIPETLGIAVAQWLRCCATNRKVASSIPAVVIGIFY